MLGPLKQEIKAGVKVVFDHELAEKSIILQPTKKEFEGQYTFVVFPLVKVLKQGPKQLAKSLGEQLTANSALVSGYNVVKGFLNLELEDVFWLETLENVSKPDYLTLEEKDETFMVEYASPNTNKPLHLGHIRNILLGWSMSQIAEACGYKVVRTQVVNDRGIAICKGMKAWELFANGETPESAGIKGDHFVGKYYVAYNEALKEEYENWQQSEDGKNTFDKLSKDDQDAATFFSGYKNKYFNENSALGASTREMLLQWEAGEPEVMDLWKRMNGWVYEGFDETYKKLGVHFDYSNYESNTYLLGKEFVEQGLTKNLFYREDDGSVWIDLEDAKMDKKIVLRSDGTSVYMTQDLGTAHKRYEQYKMNHLVYVVGNEQDYHFKVLFEILKRLGEPYADNLYHLSYGMVELPSGKMKSREGTVVDADDLIAEVVAEAKASSEERGGIEGLSDEDQNAIYRKVGMAALKYFMIKVNPKKGMVFDPKESVDMQGQTGPYIQNAYVRIQSIFRKADVSEVKMPEELSTPIENIEKELLVTLESYPEVLKESLERYDPSNIANYCYSLAKGFHKFYHDCRILGAENEQTKQFRLYLSQTIGRTLASAMNLLGIEMPEYM